jgi:hypothetical protein
MQRVEFVGISGDKHDILLIYAKARRKKGQDEKE